MTRRATAESLPLPFPQAPTPPASGPRAVASSRCPGLLPDARPGMFERRRGDCARLAAAEEEWIAGLDGAQARCPEVCLSFVPRGASTLLTPHRGSADTTECPAAPVKLQLRPGLGGWRSMPEQIIEQDDAARDRAIQRHADKVSAETRGGSRGGQTETGRPEYPKVEAARIRAILLAGSLDHYELAEKLGVQPAMAAHALTHLRNVGHLHRESTRKRERTNPIDSRPSRTVGVWALTEKGRAEATREARGAKRVTYNDAGFMTKGSR